MTQAPTSDQGTHFTAKPGPGWAGTTGTQAPHFQKLLTHGVHNSLLKTRGTAMLCGEGSHPRTCIWCAPGPRCRGRVGAAPGVWASRAHRAEVLAPSRDVAECPRWAARNLVQGPVGEQNCHRGTVLDPDWQDGIARRDPEEVCGGVPAVWDRGGRCDSLPRQSRPFPSQGSTRGGMREQRRGPCWNRVTPAARGPGSRGGGGPLRLQCDVPALSQPRPSPASFYSRDLLAQG